MVVWKCGHWIFISFGASNRGEMHCEKLCHMVTGLYEMRRTSVSLGMLLCRVAHFSLISNKRPARTVSKHGSLFNRQVGFSA